MQARGLLLCWALVGLPLQMAKAQLTYEFATEVPVQQGGEQLTLAWAGGLDMAQYNQLDLDQDGRDDLVIFDRHNHKIYTFLFTDQGYRYVPEYEHYFPAGLENWLLLRDYNCDGRPDIFTSSIFGMSLYENITPDGGMPAWSLVHETIFTEGPGSQINLQVAGGDLPAISDVDSDGDLDILVFDFALGGGVHWHKNMSMERTGTCGLDLVKVTERYGDFEECTCNSYIFGSEVCPAGGRLQHSGGKAILSADLRQTGLQDLVIGQENCTYCGYLPNTGTAEQPLMTSVRFDFPNSQAPITLDFPAVFSLDIDQDGDDDLLATNNYFAPAQAGYRQNNWLYLRQGGGYELATKGFLQKEMLEVGYAAAPALADPDADGDVDLLVGSGSQGSGARLNWYSNTGDALNPQLALADSNYLDIAADGFERVVPYFLDVDGNGWPDLLLTLQKSGGEQVRVYLHSGHPLQPYNADNFITWQMPQLNPGDIPCFFRQGSALAMLVGRVEGRLSKYLNHGDLSVPDWQLEADNYLGISDNYKARNLRVALSDLDGDGRQDLLRYDDSGEIKIHADYRGENRIVSPVLLDTVSMATYYSSLGKGVVPATGYLTGRQLPDLVMGLRTGGLVMLRNHQDDRLSGEIAIRVAVYPNPLSSGDILQVVANQPVTASVLNLQGQVLLGDVSLRANEPAGIELHGWRPGLYLLVAQNETGQRQVLRFVVLD